MPTPTIDNLPPAPSPTDSRAEFSTKTFNFYAALAGFIAQMNAATGWIVAQLATMAGYVSTTTTARDQANAAAAAAAASSNAVKWVSGTTYAEGAVVWSPGTYQAYRRKTAGAGATDPASDNTNWELAARDAVGALVSINASTTAIRYRTYALGTAALDLALPTPAYAGDWVGIVPPLGGTANTQRVTRNGHLLLGLSEDMDIDVSDPMRLAYVSPAIGWIATT